MSTETKGRRESAGAEVLGLTEALARIRTARGRASRSRTWWGGGAAPNGPKKGRGSRCRVRHARPAGTRRGPR